MRLIFIFFLTILTTGSIFGQGGNLGQLEMNVLDEYKARIGEAVKISDFPDFKDTSARKLPVNYQINSQPLHYSFEPEPLPPATIAKLPVKNLLNGMVKAGYGLYNTPLLEVYYNSGRSSQYQYGFFGKHLSTSGGVKNIRYSNNGLADNRLGGYYNRFYNQIKWNSSVFAEFDKVSYYGRPMTDSLENLDEEEPRYNWYRKFGLSTKLIESSDKGLGFYKEAGLDYYHLSDNYQSVEDNVRLNSTLQLNAADQPLEVDVNFSYFRTTNDSSLSFPVFAEGMEQSIFTVQLRPTITTYWNDLLFKFALNLYINGRSTNLDNDEGAKAAFFPEILVSYPVVKDVVNVYGGVKGAQKHNTFNSLLAENIFTEPGQLLIPTRTTDIFIGTNGVLSSNATFDLNGGFRHAKDMILFYRNPFYIELDSIAHGVGVLYDDVSSFYVNGEVSLNLKDNFQLNLSGTLNSYNSREEALAWHRPKFTSRLNAIYTYREKVNLRTELFYSGKREAFEQKHNPDLEATLQPYLHANLGIEYLYNQRLSAFVNVYNLFNSRYEHYLGYQAQSINILLGIGYQF